MSLPADLLVASAGGLDALKVFGLFRKTRPKDLHLRLASDAMADRSLEVVELGALGGQTAVPTVGVRNLGDQPVLFLMGEPLRGGRQNRVVNSSTLVAAHATVAIPVSCVEQRRWQSGAPDTFGSHESVSSFSLRSVLAKSRGTGHQADQSTVWVNIGETLTSLNVHSRTCDMLAADVVHHNRIADLVASVEFFPTAAGLAVAIADRLVSLDLFLNAQICGRMWRRIVRGCALDALQSRSRYCTATADDVRSLLSRAAEAAWIDVPPAGAGQERRATLDHWSGSLLSLDGELIHASFVCTPTAAARQPAA